MIPGTWLRKCNSKCDISEPKTVGSPKRDGGRTHHDPPSDDESVDGMPAHREVGVPRGTAKGMWGACRRADQTGRGARVAGGAASGEPRGRPVRLEVAFEAGLG